VPVAHNAGEYWRRNAFLTYPGIIQVHIGPAIDPSQFNANEITQQAEDWIEARMGEMARHL
jgi:1-acyl-sn-glycerol-3-phosphate acyltransferase